MTGFSIREQLLIGRRMKERRWRKGSFLHQLSLNGALLLAPNHDPIWQEALWTITGRPDVGWTTNQQIFRIMPAGVVRQILWHASLEWWQAMMTYRQDIAEFALERGLLEIEEVESLDRDLDRVALQLEQLAWCAVDQEKGRIKTV